MLKQKKILITDLDDTISDTYELINLYAEKYNREVLKRNNNSLNNISYKNCYYFMENLNWNDDDAVGFFKYYYPNYLENIPCKESAKLILNKLFNDGWQIHILTARRELKNNIVKKITEDWLSKNGIKYNKLCLNQINKSDYLKRFENSIFIDDSYDNCIDAINNSNAKVFFMSNKYNKQRINENIISVNSWNNLYENICDI